MTGGPAALEAARTEGPGSCGLQGHADCAVSLTARDSSSWFGQQGQDPHGKQIDGAMNRVRKRRRCFFLVRGRVELSCLVPWPVAVEIPLLG